MDEEEDNMESKEIIEDQLVSIISKDYLDVFSEYLILLGTYLISYPIALHWQIFNCFICFSCGVIGHIYTLVLMLFCGVFALLLSALYSVYLSLLHYKCYVLLTLEKIPLEQGYLRVTITQGGCRNGSAIWSI